MSYAQEEAFLSYLLLLTVAFFLATGISLAFFKERFAIPLAVAGLICLACIWICETAWVLGH
jgi:hypothetical protein